MILSKGFINAWQRNWGFNGFYDGVFDFASKPFGGMNAEIFNFTYGERTWMIEFWKGNYPGMNSLSAVGAEIGVYYNEGNWFNHYFTVDDDNLLTMSFSLYDAISDTLIFSRGPETHW